MVTTIQLSPETMNMFGWGKLGKPEENDEDKSVNQTDTGSPSQTIQLDPETSRNLSFQNNGSSYQAPDTPEARQANQELYDAQGEPIFGIPGLPRTMEKLDEEGNKRTEFVMAPPAEGDNTKNAGLQANDVAMRVVTGGALNAARGIAGFGEWALDQMMQGAKENEEAGRPDVGPGAAALNVARGLDALLGTEFSDADKNWFDENFARMPAASELEQTAQDITGMVMGGAAGGKSAAALNESLGLSKGAANILTQLWPRLMKADPANAAKKFDTAVKMLLIEQGANIGGTLPMDATTQAISQTGMGPIPGVLPDQVGGLSKQETNRLANYLDNNLVSGGLLVAGKALGVPLNFINNTVLKGFERIDKAQKVGRTFLQALDPDTANIDSADLAVRLGVLGEVAAKNADFASGIKQIGEGAQLQGDTAYGLFNGGARQYVDTVYGDSMRSRMSPDEYEKWATDKADQIVQNIISLKRSVMLKTGGGGVAASDAKMTDKVNQGLINIADQASPEEMSVEAGKRMGGAVVDDLTQAKESVSRASANKELADSALTNTQNDNALSQLLQEAAATGQLGANGAAKERLMTMGRDDLLKAWKQQRKTVDEAYAAIPNNIEIDPLELAQVVKQSGDEENILRTLDIIPPKENVGRVGDTVVDETGNITESPVQDLATRIANEGWTLKDLVTKVKPAISKEITAGMKAGATGKQRQDLEGLRAINDYIDSLMESSNEPSIRAAQDAYKRFADTWLQTTPLKNFDAEAQQMVPFEKGAGNKYDYTGPMRNQIPTQQAGYDAMQAALKDPTRLELPKILEALSKSTPGGDEALNEATLGTFLEAVSAAKGANPQLTLETAAPVLQTWRNALKQTNPDLLTQFDGAIDDLTKAGTDANSAKVALDKARQIAAEMQVNAQQKAAYRFVSEANGMPVVSTNIASDFERMFKDPQAKNIVGNLVQEAKAAGDDLAVRGIQGELGRYIAKRIGLQKSIGINQGEFVRDASGKQLLSILNEGTDPTLETLRSAYAASGDTETPQLIQDMLQFLSDNINLRSAKAQTYGSDTILNQGMTAQGATSVLTRMVFGPLTRTGTRVNALANLVFGGRQESMEQGVYKLLENVLTDPNFITNVRNIAKDDPTGTAVGNFLNKALWKPSGGLTKPVLGGIKERNADREMNDLFPEGNDNSDIVNSYPQLRNTRKL